MLRGQEADPGAFAPPGVGTNLGAFDVQGFPPIPNLFQPFGGSGGGHSSVGVGGTGITGPQSLQQRLAGIRGAKSTAKVKRSVLNRFVEARKRALEMLREERA